MFSKNVTNVFCTGRILTICLLTEKKKLSYFVAFGPVYLDENEEKKIRNKQHRLNVCSCDSLSLRVRNDLMQIESPEVNSLFFKSFEMRWKHTNLLRSTISNSRRIFFSLVDSIPPVESASIFLVAQCCRTILPQGINICF